MSKLREYRDSIWEGTTETKKESAQTSGLRSYRDSLWNTTTQTPMGSSQTTYTPTAKEQNRTEANSRMEALPSEAYNRMEEYVNFNAEKKANFVQQILNGANGYSDFGQKNAEMRTKDIEIRNDLIKNYGLSSEDIDYYAENWDKIKGIKKAQQYEEKRENALGALSESETQQLRKLIELRESNDNNKIQQFVNSVYGDSDFGQMVANSTNDYNAAKGKFLSETGYTEEEYERVLQYMQETVDNSRYEQMVEDAKKGAKDPFTATMATVGSVLASPFSGALATAENVKSWFYADKEAPVNTRSGLYTLQNLGEVYESAIAEEIAKEDELGAFAYQVGTSTAKSALNMLIAGGIGKATGGSKAAKLLGEVVGLLPYGTAAFSGTVKQYQDAGLSTEQATKVALAAGLNEMMLEKLPMDNLFGIIGKQGKTTAKEFVLNILKQGGVEGFEEVGTEVLNTLADAMVNGDFDTYHQNVRAYMTNGLTEQQAEIRAGLDWAAGVWESFAAGAISGGLMGGAGGTIQKVNYHNMAKSVNANEKTKEAVLEVARSLDDETTAKRLAVLKGEKITDAQMGQVIESMTEVLSGKTESAGNEFKYAIEEKLVELGETREQAKEDVKVLMEAAMAESESVTEEEHNTRMEKFAQNDNLSAVYGQMLRGEIKTPLTDALERVQGTYQAAKYEKQKGDAVVKATLDGNERAIVVEIADSTKGTVRLADNRVVPLESLSIEDKNMQQLYRFATTFDDTKAANALIENWTGETVGSYERAMAVFYNAGRVGKVSFDSLIKSPKNGGLVASVNDSSILRIMYDLGTNATRTEKKASKQTKIAPVQSERKGTVVDNRTYKSDQRMVTLSQAVAEKTGMEITLNDELEDNANGYFVESLSRIALSSTSRNQYKTLVHELQEVANTYNPEGMAKVFDKVLDFMNTEAGAQYLTERVEKYHKAYSKVEKDKTYASSSEEYVFDVIAEAFATPEGIETFSQWLAEDSPKEHKSILETIADFFKKLVDTITSYVEEHTLTTKERQLIEKDKQFLNELLRETLDVLDVAVGRMNSVENNSTESNKKSLNVKNGLGLLKYTEHEMKNFSNGRTFFAETKNDIESFVKEYVHKKPYSRILCGKIDEELARRIEKDTGINVFNYNVAITSEYENKHINPEKEAEQGMIAMTPDKVALLPEIITNYDKAEYAGYNKQQQQVIRFEKDIDGRRVAVEYVSKGRKTIDLQTMYGWEKKEKNSHQASHAKAHDRTSKTDLDMSSSNDSVSQSSGNATEKSLNIDAEYFKYENLIKQPAIPLLKKDDYGLEVVEYSKSLKRADVMEVTRNNIAAYNRGKNDFGSEALWNNYIGIVEIGSDGLRHPFRRFRGSEAVKNAIISTELLPLYLENAIPINDTNVGRGDKSDKSYILIGALRYDSEDYIMRIMVSEEKHQLEEIEVLYAIDTKKEEDVAKATRANPLSSSNISIANLLEIIKEYFPNELSEDVANHLGYARDKSDIEGLRHSLQVDDFWDTYMDEEMEQDNASIIEEGFDALKHVSIDEKVMRKVANRIKKDFATKYPMNDLTDNLTRIFAYIKNTENVNYSDMVRIMKEVASPVIEQSTEVDEWQKNLYEDFRDYFKDKTIRLNEEQQKEVEYYYDSFEKFRKHNFGNFTFSTSKGTYLDDLWLEIVQQSGNMLDDTVSPADQPIALVDAFHALKPSAKNIYGMNTEQASYDLALNIYKYFFMEQAQEAVNAEVKKKALKLQEKSKEYRTKVKREYEVALKEIKKQDAEKRTEMKEKYEFLLKQATKSKESALKDRNDFQHKKYVALENKYKEQLRLANQEVKDAIISIKASNRQNMLAKRDYQEAQRLREHIKRTAKSIITHFNTNTDKQHVPEVLKDTVAKFVTSIDFVGERANPNSEETLAWVSSLSEMYFRLSSKDAAEDGGYEDIYAVLNGFEDAGDIKMSSLLEDMNYFISNNSGKRITEMAMADLEMLDNIISGLKRAIVDINKLYVNKRTNDITKLGNDSISELKDKRDRKAHHKLTQMGINLLDIDMMDARSYFTRLGEAAESIYDELRTALNNRTWLIKEAQDHVGNVLQGINLSDWTGENAKVHTFVIRQNVLKMTTGQIMALYKLRQRGQAELHLQLGGIRPTEFTEKDGMKRTLVSRVSQVKLTLNEIDKIVDVLTPEQKKVADQLQKFMEVNCAKWGNKASMQMYGYERFGATNYFPIKTDGNAVETRDNNRYWGVKNQGITKQTKKNANNAIVVDDIFNVFTNHVVEMATYSTYTAPLMDAMKWFNYRSKDIDAFNETVKSEIERAYGREYLEFFKKLIKDINAESTKGFESAITDKLTPNMKVASVGANIRVAIQQPTAYLRAAAVLEPKYLGKAVFTKKGAEKAKEKSAIALWKSWGYFETNIGKSMKDVITGQANLKEKLVNYSMVLTQKADDFTWGYLWNACELEIRDKYPEVKEDTTEFDKLVSERFDEVVDQTQVVDTVLHRSHMMRSDNGAVRMATSFMAEPTKSYNMLVNYIRDARDRGDMKSFVKDKGFKRAVVAYVATNILNAILTSLIDAARYKEDDDKTYGERYLEYLNENIKDGINPVSSIPYVKDIKSILDGYGVDRMDMQGIANMVNGGQALYKYMTDESYREKYTFFEVSKRVLRGASQVFGMPAYNLMRDVEALYNNVTGDFLGGVIRSDKRQAERLITAYLTDNDKLLNEVMTEQRDKGMDDNEIQSDVIAEVGRQYKDGERTKEAVEEVLEETGCNPNEIFFKIRNWDYNIATGETGSTYSYLKDAIDLTLEKDNADNRYALRQEVKLLLEHGVEKKNIASSLASKYKEEYLSLLQNGNISRAATLKNILIQVYQSAGYSYEESKEKIDNWSN